MNGFIGHFMTVVRHKSMVLRHCVKCGIVFRGIMHDMSKFSPEEFIPGVKYYQGTRSPNEKERELFGYSRAWMHHKGRNKHHYEYWTDYNPISKNMEPVKMPAIYLAEMFCDRVAASKIYMKDKYTDNAPLEYFQRGRARHIMHKDTMDMLERLLTILSNEGEEAAFSYLRGIIKNGY